LSNGPSASSDAVNFLKGSGEMAGRIRSFDWAATPLGPIEAWPRSLKTATGLIVQSPVPIVMLWGPDGVMIYNDAYSAFAGRRHPDLLGSNVLDGWPEVAAFNANVMKVGMAGGTLAYRDQELTLSRNGVPEQVWMNLDYSPVIGEDGEPAGVIAIVIETTESHRAVAALRELNADLERRVIERAQARGVTWQVTPDLMGALNSQGYFETSNPAWKSILGWSEAEVTSMSIFEMLHPDDVERTRAGFDLTQIGQPAIRFPNRYRCKDGGYRWISWVGVPEDGMVYCTGRDITEEVAAQEELAQAQEALRQSQKMEAVGQLTGGIAHDFNNLLTGIAGGLEMIERRLSEKRLNGVERYIYVAQASTHRAAALTQRLLAFSRRQTLDPKPTDVNRLIVGMADLIRRTVGPAIEVEVVEAGGLWSTRVDPSQLENSLLNLAINARDAMPDGGRLTIETANKWLDDRAARERELPPGQYLSLCVTDTGTGMPPEVISRVFDPFFTTKPLGQGTGLGLSMIHGFVRQSGGQVRVYSEVDKGTTMCLYLPRHMGDAEAPEAIDAAASAEPGHGETVLVIDDEEPIRMLITDVLEEAGYRVLTAPDGPAGLKTLQSDVRIDLLITDVGLPGGFNGRQVADAARATRPDLKVLFITGYAENAVVGNGHLEPGMQVITKPFAIAVLATRVREIIES
jgi:PAS domain S-box-containing protein